MKYLKLFITWILSFFNKKPEVEPTKVEKHPSSEVDKTHWTHKQKRDHWLKSMGYTAPEKLAPRPIRTSPISSYKAQILKFMELKRKGLIDIKSYRNKQAIPFYTLINKPKK